MSLEKAGSGGDDAFSISEMMRAYRISRSKLYDEIRAGRLRVMKIGARSVVTALARQEWERRCEKLPLRPGIMKGKEGGNVA